MTQDEIIKLANEAELCQTIWIEEDCIEIESVIQFAKLVAEREREACAKIADEWAVGWPHPSRVIAERIRAKGET